MSDNKNKEKKGVDSFSAVVHHMRNPVYILRGYLDALFSGDLGELSEKQKKYLKICLESAEEVNHIVTNLICVVEIEEGRYEIKKEPVDIVLAADEAVGKSVFLARASNAKISLATGERSLSVVTDPDKIQNVIDAFLVNAIKYKKEGEGKVEVKIEKKENEAIVSIKDSGTGVPEKEKEKIFEKFYRTKRAIEIDPNSLGLGLYISKVIIEDCGGKTWVENNKEGGATFYFTLPLKKENIES